MKALVTGGAGFIGTNLVRALLARGDDVCVLDNFQAGRRSNLEGLDIRLVEGDVRDAQTVANAMEKCDTVFHLAASVGNVLSIRDPRTDATVNVIGTVNVLESARSLGVRKIVFASSAAIFGELKKIPIREDHPAEPDAPYGASKLAAEKLCLLYAKLYSIQCVCLRYFNVYGSYQRYDAYGNVIPIFAHQIYKGLPLTIFGDGEQTRDFVYVSDVVAATMKAADVSGIHGAFNIASAQRVTINRLAEMMVAYSGVKVDIIHASPRQGDVRDSLADVSAARDTLGYQPAVTLERGLRDYLRWVKGET